MDKFKVSRGDVSREVEAADKAEALRKFDAPEVTTTVDVVESNLADPPKHRYEVTWGDETKLVEAVHEADAWSQFVGGDEDTLAYKRPGMFRRVIKDLGPVPQKDKDGNDIEPTDEDESDDEGVSPVANVNADEAKDKISRMTSHDKLQAIVDHDTRSSVVAAASARQTELGGS